MPKLYFWKGTFCKRSIYSAFCWIILALLKCCCPPKSDTNVQMKGFARENYTLLSKFDLRRNPVINGQLLHEVFTSLFEENERKSAVACGIFNKCVKSERHFEWCASYELHRVECERTRVTRSSTGWLDGRTVDCTRCWTCSLNSC